MSTAVSTPPVDQFVYRYFDTQDTYGFGVQIKLAQFFIEKRTPKGCYYIDHHDGRKRKYVCWNWSKKHAHKTIEEAQLAFMKRKRNQCLIVERQLTQAKNAYQKGIIQFGLDEDPKFKILNDNCSERTVYGDPLSLAELEALKIKEAVEEPYDEIPY